MIMSIAADWKKGQGKKLTDWKPQFDKFISLLDPINQKKRLNGLKEK